MQAVILSLPNNGSLAQIDKEKSKEIERMNDQDNLDSIDGEGSPNKAKKEGSRQGTPISSTRSKQGSRVTTRPGTAERNNNSSSSNKELDAKNAPNVSIAPAAVIDPSHRVIYTPTSGMNGAESPAPGSTGFKFAVYDVSNDVDRGYIAKVKGILEAKIGELDKRMSALGKKESDDSKEMKKVIDGLQEQLFVINSKLERASKLKKENSNGGSLTINNNNNNTINKSTTNNHNNSKQMNENVDVNGFMDTILEDGRNVRVFVAPEMSPEIADTLNELLARIENLENVISELRMASEISKDSESSENLNNNNNNNSSSSNLTETPGDHIELAKKADKSQVDLLSKQIKDMTSQLRSLSHELNKKADRDKSVDVDAMKDLETLVSKKADRSELESLVASQLNQQPSVSVVASSNSTNATPRKIGGDFSADAITDLREAINAHAQQIDSLIKSKADKLEVFKALNEKGEMVDRLSQTKADANVVARKAERVYVDAALNKMRKELEQLLNSTNANTSELVAQDLDYLRNLLDLKADKTELKKLRDAIVKTLHNSAGDDGSGGGGNGKTGEGLAGHKAFKCLSCNRMMSNGMRVRPQAMNFTNFVSHLPNPKGRMLPRQSIGSGDYKLASLPLKGLNSSGGSLSNSQNVSQQMQQQQQQQQQQQESNEMQSRNGVLLPPIEVGGSESTTTSPRKEDFMNGGGGGDFNADSNGGGGGDDGEVGGGNTDR